MFFDGASGPDGGGCCVPTSGQSRRTKLERKDLGTDRAALLHRFSVNGSVITGEEALAAFNRMGPGALTDEALKFIWEIRSQAAAKRR